MTKKSLNNKDNTNKKRGPNRLSPRERDFCSNYVQSSNGVQSVMKAGYHPQDEKSAGVMAVRLLKRDRIKAEIKRLTDEMTKSNIMSATEVMEHFTAIARGEEKDQFGLDIGASDRIKALVELAKRTIDVENRIAGKPDSRIEIKLDWNRDTEESTED